jgi:hypothetical protein
MLVVVCCDYCTSNIVTRDTNDVCPTSVSDADDVTVTSSSQMRRYILIIVLPLVTTHLRAGPNYCSHSSNEG